MYDKSLITESLLHIETTLLFVLKRTEEINDPDDFALTPTGMEKLDSAIIRLMATGEEINRIDKRTKGTLLQQYPEIEWGKIIGFRNIVAHAYFDADALTVFEIVKNDVKPLLLTIQKIIADL
jgi:uncharacterized protein with HEPN domain